jgi:hypothetical protein
MMPQKELQENQKPPDRALPPAVEAAPAQQVALDPDPTRDPVGAAAPEIVALTSIGPDEATDHAHIPVVDRPAKDPGPVAAIGVVAIAESTGVDARQDPTPDPDHPHHTTDVSIPVHAVSSAFLA